MEPVAIIGILLVSSAIGAGVAYLAAASASRLHRDRIELTLREADLRLENVLQQIQTWADAGERERKRVDQTDQRARRRAREEAPPAPRYANAAAYKRALERGEARDLATERALGLVQ